MCVAPAQCPSLRLPTMLTWWLLELATISWKKSMTLERALTFLEDQKTELQLPWPELSLSMPKLERSCISPKLVRQLFTARSYLCICFTLRDNGLMFAKRKSPQIVLFFFVIYILLCKKRSHLACRTLRII